MGLNKVGNQDREINPDWEDQGSSHGIDRF